MIQTSSIIAILSSVMGIRLFSIFLALPCLVGYASGLSGSTPVLIGIAMGIYGLSQSLIQIPLGILCDRYNPYLILYASCIIFIIGGFICVSADHIAILILGRFLQGAGSAGVVIMTLVSWILPDHQRPIAMTWIGASIGIGISLGMTLGPVLKIFMHIRWLLGLSALVGIITIGLILFLSSRSPIDFKPSSSTLDLKPCFQNQSFLIFYTSIAILHVAFSMNFMAIGYTLHESQRSAVDEAKFYSSLMLVAAIVIAQWMRWIAKRPWIPYQTVMIGGSLSLTIAACMMSAWGSSSLWVCWFCFLFFLCIFSFLESYLPSQTMRLAPTGYRGRVNGVFSTFQWFGTFLGGLLGGLLKRYGGSFLDLWDATAILVALWCMVLCIVFWSHGYGKRH